jgi:hypothetical protein
MSLVLLPARIAVQWSRATMFARFVVITMAKKSSTTRAKTKRSNLSLLKNAPFLEGRFFCGYDYLFSYQGKEAIIKPEKEDKYESEQVLRPHLPESRCHPR